uniref:Transglutaminase N-terminal domain-containing protein n=1 Tax=Pavo cristatus TaxID=9049 RepID=A0A8C9EIX6_PAVCR
SLSLSSREKCSNSLTISAAHHTSDYNSTQMILRRGQAFAITLNFQTTVQPEDNFTFIASTGPSPAESQQTKAVFHLSEDAANGWSATQEHCEPGCMSLIIVSPANAIIGRYKLKIRIVSGNKTSSALLGQFVLLFNPWCPSTFYCIMFFRKSGCHSTAYT